MSTVPGVQSYRGRRFTAGRVAVFLIIVAAFFAWEGSQKIPTGPASGTLLNGPTAKNAPSGNVVRVATFNINGEDSDATVETMRDFDLIGLQEVHGLGPFSKSNQAEVLGSKLGLSWLFAPVERQWWSEAFGDGVLTSLPVQHWQRFPLANENADSNRQLLIIQMELAGKPLNVLITHLERHSDQDSEFATCISLFTSMREPTILMGDFNLPKGDERVRSLRNTPGVIDPLGDANIDGYDRIFATGMHYLHSGSIDKGASDHPLAWAELELN